MSRQHYGEAAKHFRDPLWQGAALYRDGQFKEAAAAFARVDSPEAAFDRGNALVMLGKYSDAIASYILPCSNARIGVRRRPTVIWQKPGSSGWSRLRMMPVVQAGS
jgi:hypothetical protein